MGVLSKNQLETYHKYTHAMRTQNVCNTFSQDLILLMRNTCDIYKYTTRLTGVTIGIKHLCLIRLIAKQSA